MGDAALAHPGFKISAHTRVRAAEDDGVKTRAASDAVGPVARVDDVIAVTAVNLVITQPSLYPVVTAFRDDIIIARKTTNCL